MELIFLEFRWVRLENESQISVGHNEPEVVFRRLPLIIGEDC